MKRTTKKLSGIGLQLFLERFYAGSLPIDEALAQRLAKEGCKSFASVRVRRAAWHDWNRRSSGERTTAKTAKPESQIAAAPPVPTAALEGARPATGTFDPYAIGLIPTYQREGADGLLVKLETVTSVDDLRKMARSQQLSLPAELRVQDAKISDVRAGIVAAVGKRIADRRAAAG